MKKDVKKHCCPHGSNVPMSFMFASPRISVLADSVVQRGAGFKATQQFVVSS
jgi:hypothetical protein